MVNIRERKMAASRAVSRLIMRLDSEKYDVRLKACRNLGDMGAEAIDALPVLKKVAKNDKDEYVRHFAKLAIKKIEKQTKVIVKSKKPIVAKQIENLSNTKVSVRINACRDLAEMGAKAVEAIPKLQQMQKNDSDEYVRHFAKMAIKKITR